MGRKKITPEMENEMKRLREQGMSCIEIASLFGVSKSMVSSITQGTLPDIDENWEKKKDWPQWKEWRILHEKYGTKKAVEENASTVQAIC